MKKNNKLGSLVLAGAQIATSTFPYPFGSIFSALIGEIKDNIYQKRLEKWQTLIEERLERFKDEMDCLINNEEFATAVFKTSQLAVQTQSDEKMRVLANALFNTYECNIEEDKMFIFLHLVEKYTCTHIRVLKYFHDEYCPSVYKFPAGTSTIVVIRMDFKDLEHSYLEKIINDLQNDSLVNQFNYNSKALLFGKGDNFITELGNEFYNFIKDTSNKS